MADLTIVSHTSAPGGGELAISRYLRATRLDLELVTMEAGPIWDGLPRAVTLAPTYRALASALRRGDGPVVANSMRAALMCAALAPRRRPLAYWVRDGLTHSAMSRRAIAVTKAVTARRASTYLANSAWTADTVVDALGVDREQVQIVPSLCGVTAEHVQPPRVTVSDGPLRLLFLGRLSPWKAPHVAVQALPLLRQLGMEVTLTIAGGAHFGETAYADDLRDLVGRTAGAELVGHVADPAELLREHDVAVHCSVRPEPFGQVIVQALAASLPVAATTGGGPSEILTGSPVPLLYPGGDPRRLAQVVMGVVENYAVVSQWAAQRALHYLDEHALSVTDQVLGAMSSMSTTRWAGEHADTMTPCRDDRPSTAE